ncbi:MAG: protein jag [Rubrobacteraceae bacterium]|nr:protein jag [Rubrobacteraceae bacterium]
MTEDREFYAETVQDAVGKAADELGLSPQELNYRVLDEGSTGFLGIGARDARVVVETEHSAPPAASDDDEPADAPLDDDEATDPAEPQPADIETDPEPSSLAEVYGGSPDADQAEAPEELLEEVRVLISSILEAMNFDASVEVYDAGGFIAADVAPSDTALFIGQKGETIDALQYLVNVAAFKERSFFKRIVLDAEGYRQRRVEAIQGMAHRTARRAVRERRTVEMPPMNSSERRVVHMYLSENPNVSTESEGSGDSRRVMVSPSS